MYVLRASAKHIDERSFHKVLQNAN
jgi:hypothetical protein